MKQRLFEDNTHSFIVRIWLEETTEQADRGTWRGRITHLPSGEQCYVKDLDGISAFVAPYLRGMGVETGGRHRVRDCLKQLRARVGRALLG